MSAPTLAAASLLASALPLAAQAAGAPARIEPVAAVSIQPTDPSPPSGSAENPIPKDYALAASGADKVLPTDPSVVTNGPIPDTPANRALYGQPMSRAGRAGQPSGN